MNIAEAGFSKSVMNLNRQVFPSMHALVFYRYGRKHFFRFNEYGLHKYQARQV